MSIKFPMTPAGIEPATFQFCYTVLNDVISLIANYTGLHGVIFQKILNLKVWKILIICIGFTEMKTNLVKYKFF